MSNPIHDLDRVDAVSAVFGGLPLNEVEARDALEAIQHEFRIYETETRELYLFVGNARRLLESEVESRDPRLFELAKELEELADRIQKGIQTLPRTRTYAVLDETVSLTPTILD